MEKITPHLWFDKDAKEAAEFYTSTFEDSIIKDSRTLHNTSGSVDILSIKLLGQEQPKAEQCGWLKDKYGVSWQIVPMLMDEMLKSKDKQKIARVTEAFLKMKKFDIAKLKQAYEG